MSATRTIRTDEKSGEAAAEAAPFPVTSWTIVRRVAASDPARAKAAFDTLAATYRRPVLAYLRHEGYMDEETEALANRFFAEQEQVLAAGGPTSTTEPFRVWLLRALENFVGSDPDPTETVPFRKNSSPAPRATAARPVVPGFDILDELGRGGEGTVYRAYEPDAQRHVAIKVLRLDLVEDAEAGDRFRRSAALMSTLDHGNIVRIYKHGVLESGQPYYVMQLVVGGTLADRQRQERFRDPARAAGLLVKIASAVHHAHQHGILHRDISPMNVLMDLNDEPHVCDFLARRVSCREDGLALGKRAYSAPEQLAGNGGTVEADVYGLGAILYELCAGARPPVRDEQRGEPERIDALVPHVPREVADVCAAALSWDPQKRHPSAAVFADSLECVLGHFPPPWPKIGRWRRLQLWASRHPVLAVGAVIGALLLFVADWLTVASVRTQQAELETATLRGNATLASSQARAVLALFEKLAQEASRAAVDPEVRDFLRKDELGHSLPVARRIFERARSFDGVSLFSREARILARYPEPESGFLGREFSFRYYYRCVRELAERARQNGGLGFEPEVCVSPAYRGEASRNIEFTVAAPVHDLTGEFVGFLLFGKHAKNTLEEIEIDDVHRSGQITALFGQRDRDRHSAIDPSSRGRLTAVAHPALFGVEERALDPELSKKLVAQFGQQAAPGLQLRPVRVRPYEDANYRDPVTGDVRLAGFAPVGATGFVVGVSTPRATALGASDRHVAALLRNAVLLNCGFLLLSAVALRSSLRDVPSHKKR